MKRVERGVCGGIPEESLVDGLDAPRLDLDAAAPPPAAQVDHSLQHGDPHVELRLLRHLQVVVERVRDAVGAPRPRLDRERQLVGAGRAELDLPRLEVPVERREPE